MKRDYIVEIYKRIGEEIHTAQIVVWATSGEMAEVLAEAMFVGSDVSYVVL